MVSFPSNDVERYLSNVNQTTEITPYQNLRESQIRLAEIKGAFSHDEDVVCSLLTVSRDTALPYHALSYCWGPRTEFGKGSIKLDVGGNRVRWPVTPTLEMALRRLRSTDEHTRLLIWVDAICINQSDEQEKGEQVQEMRLVYQNAAEVSVWLGPEDDDCLLAWTLMNDIEDCHGDLAAIREFIHPIREKEFEALKAVFRREYFWRIWVVQEVACARNAVVYCGSMSMPWSSLLNVGNTLENIRTTLQMDNFLDRVTTQSMLMNGSPNILKTTNSSIMPFSETEAPPLLDLLRTHMSKGSTVPHDKVYGLVGISSDRVSFGKIDYERSPRATFIHTAHHIISTTHKLNAICIKQNGDNYFNLPSWVPDWERRSLYPRRRVKLLHIRQPPFTASQTKLARVSFTNDKEVMIADGFIIDTIIAAGQTFFVEGPKINIIPALKAFHNWFTLFVNHIGIEGLDIFPRTLCGGAWDLQYSNFGPDSPQQLTVFFDLLQKLLPGLLLHGVPLPAPAVNQDHEIAPEVLEARQRAIVASASTRMHAKRLVISRTRLAGLAPQAAEEGDHIVVLLGCDFPVVMRNMGSYWTLIGEVYVDGIMYGEAMDGLHSGKYKEQGFTIR
ncbi:uncharacterized protein PAC_17778 [Phialocephala subalpina]|uniref:Heterokaryon incompatibility domain-containing protein n=1 Tax=Phialocephala subalpina TaxID=576137 RepID=A0A1L7XSD3_9HELO|nr:uncharacterized protein PAC_17778 [Phialocephala subalpina]